MKTLKWLLAGVVVGVIVVALRESEMQDTLSADEAATDEEPFLGYDGMDQETLLDWIEAAAPDEHTVERIARYEQENRHRQPVLDALQELLG